MFKQISGFINKSLYTFFACPMRAKCLKLGGGL